MIPNEKRPSDELTQILQAGQRSPRRKRVLYILGALFLTGVLVAIAMLTSSNGEKAVTYETAEVKRGNLTVTVTATGELKPLNQVDVGTEISGTVQSVAVDFNDKVKAGQVLARLDTELLEAKLKQTRAAVDLARARVKEAQATLLESRNKVERVRDLNARGVASKENLDAAEAAYTRAEASLATAEAQMRQARAQLESDETNLKKAVILSPVSGIVLKRQIEPGQTVAASLQTPVLFTLAENLNQMELHVAVDEADVGHVLEGQRALFTVDAYPGETFPAIITQVRFSPETVEGVVTYGTVLAVDNAEGILRPGMTATADIVVKELADIILIPNAALRFTPPRDESQARQRGGGLLGSLFRGPWRRADRDRRQGGNGKDGQFVWIMGDAKPRPVRVTTGATDGQMTELVSGELEPGIPLIVDVVQNRK